MQNNVGLSINPKFYFCGVHAAFFVFPLTGAAENHLVSEKPLIQRFFKGTGVVLAEHNNRLPPVADKRRVLWRRGQRKFALQAIIFFGHRKSRERSQKSLIFASGIPAGERVDFSARFRAFAFAKARLAEFSLKPLQPALL